MKFMGVGAGKIWKLKNNQENFQKTLDICKIGGIIKAENQKEVINDDKEGKRNPVQIH